YLYYVFKKNIEHFRQSASGMGSLPQISLSVTEDFLIPIPPLKVQEEIVRILDTFTQLTNELTNELTARKQQYEYYRDKLLTFDDSVEWKTLGEIAIDIYRGSGIKREQVTKTGIPCVRYGEIYTRYGTWFSECYSHTSLEEIHSPKYFEYGDILFAITGESIKDIAKSCAYVGDKKCLAGGDIVVLKHNQNPKYISYALSTTEAKKQKSRGKIKSKVVHSSVPAIQDIKIPVPSLEEQERIVAILDRFDALCNDLTSGLPAEIEARQKQYEYYRDKLLSFKELKDE
ncbi:MAG: restriction endonuclease subunit S, partial [Allobaculum sp.]|nr:restriction endonuclease subunit S [Allobaculum sp.]